MDDYISKLKVDMEKLKRFAAKFKTDFPFCVICGEEIASLAYSVDGAYPVCLECYLGHYRKMFVREKMITVVELPPLRKRRGG